MRTSTSSSERPAAAAAPWAAGLTVLLFLVLEIGLRLTHFGPPALLRPWQYTASSFLGERFLVPVPDPAIGWKLAGGVAGFYRGAPLATNSHGFRDREWTVAKPAGVLRVAVIGASATMGAGVAAEEVYSRRLEALLDQEEPGRHELLNLAVPSYTLPQSLAAYRAFGRRFSPDAVLIRLRSNQSVSLEPPRPLAAILPRPTQLRPRLGALFVYRRLRHLVRDRSRGWLASDWRRRAAPAGGQSMRLEEFLERQAAGWAGQEARIVLALVPAMNDLDFPAPHLDSLRRRARRLVRWASRHAHVEVIDTYPRLLDALVPADRIYPGDNHPSARAHRLIAEALAPDLRRILAGLQGGPPAAPAGGDPAADPGGPLR